MAVVKVLSKASESLSDIQDEVDVLRHLRSRCGQYILCYIGAAEDRQNYYIVTKFYGDFEPLDDFIQRLAHRPQQRLQLTPRILTHLVDGLREIHDAQVAHGDIKPANILIHPRTLDIKYIDFGLACAAQRCGEAGYAGTPFYQAPELRQDKVLVPITLANLQRGDVYSLGVTVLQLLLTWDGMERFEQAAPPYRLDHAGRSSSFVPWFLALPRELIVQFPLVADDLRIMLWPDPTRRRLPEIEALPRYPRYCQLMHSLGRGGVLRERDFNPSMPHNNRLDFQRVQQ